jgi:ATP-dependent DNA helicase DinG
MKISEPTMSEALASAFERLERRVPSFERRAGQLTMACLWEAVLDRGGVLAVEAPTGIGKSLAYLVPALLRRRSGCGPILVSTHTKALQDQLLTRDAPLAALAIGSSFRAAVLKGRSGYLCRRRAGSRFAQRRLFAGLGADDAMVDALEAWTERTVTGDLDELRDEGIRIPASLLAEIASDPLFCSGSGCDPGGGCFAKAARREARRSDLVIVNHALLLSDPGLRATLLAESGALILDEAHHIERVAREQLGVSLGVRDLARLAARTDARGGALRMLARTIRRGKGTSVTERVVAADQAIRPVLDHAAALARDLEAILPPGAGSARLTREDDLASISPVALDQLLTAAGSLVRALERVAETAEAETGGALRPEAAEAIDEVRARHAAWLEVEQAIRAVTNLEERGAAFYVDRDERGSPRWNRRPLEVGVPLRSQLFETSACTLLTSATLTPGDEFEPFLASIGLAADEVETAALPSPFPLERQVRTAVLDGPDPTRPEFVARLAALVVDLAATTRRNVLVLLTSYQMLEQVAARVRAPLAQAGVPLFKQTPGEAAAPLAREFRETEGAVLLGAASFWEGVDFPGAALEVLVIARLPFPVPTDPLVMARSESIEARGGDAFRELMLPEAVLRFRQGVGRLIRTAEDRGVVVVVDSRIVRASYRARFLSTLPHPPLIDDSLEGVASLARQWLVREDATCPA